MTPDPLARALAWGFLAAPDWDEQGLQAAVRRTSGRHHRWSRTVVRAVLEAYRTPPRDRPHELACTVAAALAVVDTGSRRGPSAVRVRRITPSRAEMGVRRWPVPPVDDLPALARLLEVPLEQLPWLADLRGLQRRAPEGPLHLYRYRWVSRPGAVPRLVEAPTPLLRAVQRRLLEEVLLPVPLHPAAHGFVRGRGVLTHARAHVGAGTLVALDLRHFFAAVTAARVRGLFRSCGYPEEVASTLTGLATHRTPVRVIGAMPPGGGLSDRALLRARLRTPHLPQGAPSSPNLANLAAFVLDARLAGCAGALGAHYSRYADDLTFSGPAGLPAPRLVRAVTRIVLDEHFTVNPAKTRVRRASQRQLVTGVVVNAGLGVPREEEDRLRAVLHDAGRNGVAAANREGRADFRAHLQGRVAWVEAVNPVRGARLRRQLDALSWPSP